jgi:hypothetical protein
MDDEPKDEPKARSACVIMGASPEQVAAVADGDRITMRRNARGTLVTGRLGSLPIDWAAGIDALIYDVLYSRETGWFAVTIFHGDAQPVRWDNRPGQDAGYPRVDDILGATTPETILAALDIPPDAIGW